MVGGADAGGDAAEEIWVRVGSGASSTILALFRFRECELVAVTLNGEPAELPVGASVANTSGVTCEDATSTCSTARATTARPTP